MAGRGGFAHLGGPQLRDVGIVPAGPGCVAPGSLWRVGGRLCRSWWPDSGVATLANDPEIVAGVLRSGMSKLYKMAAELDTEYAGVSDLIRVLDDAPSRWPSPVIP